MTRKIDCPHCRGKINLKDRKPELLEVTMEQYKGLETGKYEIFCFKDDKHGVRPK